MRTLDDLANRTRPANDEDFGSDRQVDAEEEFYEAWEQTIRAHLDQQAADDVLADYAAWALKATVEERIDEALQIAAKATPHRLRARQHR